MVYLIIGAGAAGLMAAQTIREEKPDDKIIVISPEDKVFSRSLLHYYLSRERDVESLSFVPDDFFEKNKIDWVHGQQVESVDIDEQIVFTKEYEVSYDKLLIASGSQTYIPDIGLLREAKNVFTLSTIKDADTLRTEAVDAKNIVIIGAGLVGLSVAYGLLDLGKKITILEQATRIMPLQLDYEAGQAYVEAFEEKGCVFEFKANIIDTENTQDNRITAIYTKDGRYFPCDLVVVATGMVPSNDFLLDSGLKFDGDRLLVNGFLQTSNKNVYAAGDVTMLSGIWPNAKRQGETAAYNMVGRYKTYRDFYSFKNNMNYFGILTLSVGEVFEEEGDIIFTQQDKNTYRKVVVRDNCVVTAILQGDLSGAGIWQYLIKNKINVKNHLDNIWDISYVDFFELDEKGQFVWSDK